MSEETNNSSKIARNLFSKTSTQERDLATILKKRNPGDKSITQLRNDIRDNYEKIIFLDMEFAASKDVDQLLWKSVYYKAIEEFRKIIKKYQSNNDANKAATVKEKLQKTLAAFTTFLNDAVTYFESLLQKLSNETIKNEKFKSLQAGMMHKCYIILGDLSRYQQLYTDTLTKNWSMASSYYRKALELVPSSGNAQNQLAVIATYSEDEFEAVYRYFRSLAVTKPFISARENLLLLFEQSRIRYVKTCGKQNSANNFPKAFKKKKVYKEAIQSKKQVVEKFLLRYVRLHGILFSKIGVELFEETKEEATKDLQEVLKHQLLNENTILKLVIMCIFAVENSLKNATELIPQTMSFVYAIMTSLVQAANTAQSLSLGAVVVFLKYVAQHVNVFAVSRKEAQYFWSAVTDLLNSLPKLNGVQPSGMLEEDLELCGFAPIKALEKQAPVVSSSQEAQKIRMVRAVEAAKEITKAENMHVIYDNNLFIALSVEDVENDTQNYKYDFEEQTNVEDGNEETVEVEPQTFVSANFGMQNDDDNYEDAEAEDVIDVLEENHNTSTMMPAVSHSWASNSSKVIMNPSRYHQQQPPENPQSSSLFSTSSLFAPPMEPPQPQYYEHNAWYNQQAPTNGADSFGRTIKRPDSGMQNAFAPMESASYATWGNQAAMPFPQAQPFGNYQQTYFPPAQPFYMPSSPQNGTINQKKSFIS